MSDFVTSTHIIVLYTRPSCVFLESINPVSRKIRQIGFTRMPVTCALNVNVQHQCPNVQLSTFRPSGSKHPQARNSDLQACTHGSSEWINNVMINAISPRTFSYKLRNNLRSWATHTNQYFGNKVVMGFNNSPVLEDYVRLGFPRKQGLKLRNW